MAEKKISHTVNEAQLLAIQHLYEENGWEFLYEEHEESTPTVVKEECEHNDVAEPPPQEGDERCPHCLLTPCIVSDRNRQQWWEDRQYPPRLKNSEARKKHYRRFWTMLDRFGAFQKDEYKVKNRVP